MYRLGVSDYKLTDLCNSYERHIMHVLNNHFLVEPILIASYAKRHNLNFLNNKGSTTLLQNDDVTSFEILS